MKLGVMAQVDQALAAEDEERLKKMLEKQLGAVKDDIRTTSLELRHIEKVLSMLGPQAANNKDSKRKLDSVKRQKDNKVKYLINYHA